MHPTPQEPIAHTAETAPSTRRYLSVKEALTVLEVSREALYKKLKSGELPHFKFGRKILIDLDEVLATMRAK